MHRRSSAVGVLPRASKALPRAPNPQGQLPDRRGWFPLTALRSRDAEACSGGRSSASASRQEALASALLANARNIQPYDMLHPRVVGLDGVDTAMRDCLDTHPAQVRRHRRLPQVLAVGCKDIESDDTPGERAVDPHLPAGRHMDALEGGIVEVPAVSKISYRRTDRSSTRNSSPGPAKASPMSRNPLRPSTHFPTVRTKLPSASNTRISLASPSTTQMRSIGSTATHLTSPNAVGPSPCGPPTRRLSETRHLCSGLRSQSPADPGSCAKVDRAPRASSAAGPRSNAERSFRAIECTLNMSPRGSGRVPPVRVRSSSSRIRSGDKQGSDWKVTGSRTPEKRGIFAGECQLLAGSNTVDRTRGG